MSEIVAFPNRHQALVIAAGLFRQRQHPLDGIILGYIIGMRQAWLDSYYPCSGKSIAFANGESRRQTSTRETPRDNDFLD